VILAIIDTNIWVSALLNPSGYPARVIANWKAGRFTLLFSDYLFEEVRQVLHRPRIKDKYHLRKKSIEELLSLIRQKAAFVYVTGKLDVCRDKDDNLLIETAVRGGADYLVTRDEDISRDLDVHRYLRRFGVKVVTVAQFLREIAKARRG